METRRQPVEEDPLLPYHVSPTDRIQVNRLDTKPYLLSLLSGHRHALPVFVVIVLRQDLTLAGPELIM